MATISLIEKVAREWFSDQMRIRGFAVERRFTFWRKRGPLFDLLWSEVLSGGRWLRVGVTIWSPWVDDPEGRVGKFPPSSFLIGGTLSNKFPQLMMGGHLYEVETADSIRQSLTEILADVDRNAIPWFATVDSLESYMSYVGKGGSRPPLEYREKVRRGLELGFQREPLY